MLLGRCFVAMLPRSLTGLTPAISRDESAPDWRCTHRPTDGGGCEPSTPFCERPLNQVMDMLLPPRAAEPLRAAQPVHIRA